MAVRRRAYTTSSNAAGRFFRRLFDYLAMAAFFLIVAIIAAYFGEIGQSEHQGQFHVIDGDSLALGNERFRLEGIDAPEARQICQIDTGEWQCGRQSTQYLKSLMNAKKVVCRGVGVDKYERILARCYAGSLDINREMVLQGWAVSYGSYGNEERIAKSNQAGLWVGQFIPPRQWREIHGSLEDVGQSETMFEAIASRFRLWFASLVTYWSG